MWTKICGICDLNTARQVAELRPDAIGLNFFTKSPRSVQPGVAADIVRALPEGIEPVAVFVKSTVEEIVATCRDCRIRTIQLHGDETAEFTARLAELLPDANVIVAFRLGVEGFGALSEFLAACQRLGRIPAAVLVDAHVESAYGGTGRRPPWDIVNAEYHRTDWPPLILAGGLSPDNVAEAIRNVRPWGVDVASGVETHPGEKNIPGVKQFIERAALAFAEIETNNPAPAIGRRNS